MTGLRIVESFDDAIELREWAKRQPALALDTETTGVDIYDPSFKVRTIQFGTKSEAWFVPFAPWIGMVETVINEAHLLRIHNSPFDIGALATHGVVIPWHKVDDTMIAMRLAEPHKRSGLKDAAARHVSAAAADAQIDLKKAMKRNGWGWDTIPLDFPTYRFYAAMDTILTARLAETKACREGFASPVYPLEMDVRKVCSTMERNGMRVDIGFCETKLEELRDQAEDIKDDYRSLYGINIGSTAELGRQLRRMGVQLGRMTEGGADSVSKDSLEEALVFDNPDAAQLIDDVLRFRRLTKMTGTYLNNFIELADTRGLLHPSIETCAARTGRSSIRNPALQTLPRGDDPDTKLIRQAVVPRDGEMLVSSDFSQIELRLIAIHSGDEGLIQAFAEADAPDSPADFFTAATRLIYKDDSIVKSDPRRTLTKNCLYGASYGAGIPKMAATARVSVEAMAEVSEAVFARYRGVKGLMRRFEREARENDGWITTPAGRRLKIDEGYEYKALNAFIQGAAADEFKMAMVDLACAGLEEAMVVPVHDEVLFSVPPEDAEELRQTIGEVMSRNEYVVPIPAGPSEPAKTWGDVDK